MKEQSRSSLRKTERILFRSEEKGLPGDAGEIQTKKGLQQ
jgi:hypothetical protein